MWKAIGIDEFVDGCEDVLVTRNVFESGRSVFLNPK